MANDYFDYQPTQKELDDFKKTNSGYSIPFKTLKGHKPTNGSLILIDGENQTVIKNDLPIPLLQHLRTEMIKNCYKGKNLKIKYKV